jgi:hypothetical protein
MQNNTTHACGNTHNPRPAIRPHTPEHACVWTDKHTVSPLTTYHTGPHTQGPHKCLPLLGGGAASNRPLSLILLYCSERIQISDTHTQTRQHACTQVLPVSTHTQLPAAAAPGPHSASHPSPPTKTDTIPPPPDIPCRGHLPATSVFPGHSASLATDNMTQLPASTKQKTLHAPTTPTLTQKAGACHTHPPLPHCLPRQAIAVRTAGRRQHMYTQPCK